MNNKKKLKIAQIAPLSERVPPKKYGGTEHVVHTLTEGLIKEGHDVTLFASGDSITSAKLVSVYPRGLREAKIHDPYGLNEWSLVHILNAYKKQNEFDVIHDHNSIFSIPVAQFAKTPTIVTLHGIINHANKKLYRLADNLSFVAISNSQRRLFERGRDIAVVYNSLPLGKYLFQKKHDGFLLFVGRMSMEKGPHIAIDVAQALGIPIILAAKLDPEDMPYFKKYVEPRLNEELVVWVGEINEKDRNKLMSRAMCLLYPLTWSEPFGLVMIEAMANGCPVIAFNEGSVPELIVDKKTGFIVSDVEEMIEAVENIALIKREECRTHVFKNFNSKKMVEGYEKLYFEALKQNG